MKKKKTIIVCRVLFVLYLGILLDLLFFSAYYGRTEHQAAYSYNLQPFREIMRFWSCKKTLPKLFLVNVVGNVAAFVPFGFLLPCVNRRFSHGYACLAMNYLFSFLVESLQLITQTGIFDIDDLLLNTLGGGIGYVLYRLLHRGLKGRR